MCCGLPFCVGERVYISDGRPILTECWSAPVHSALVYSISIPVATPMSPPACVFGVKGPNSTIVTTHTLLPSAQHNYSREDTSLIFVSPSGNELRIVRKVVGDDARRLPGMQSVVPHPLLVVPKPPYLRFVNVYRLFLEQNLQVIKDVRNLKKENRRLSRPTCITVKDIFTLVEWEDLVRHVKRISSDSVIYNPDIAPGHSSTLWHNEMTLEIPVFMELMASLGAFDKDRFLQYIAVSKTVRKSTTRDSSLALRIIGDYVKADPSCARASQFNTSGDTECIISAGSSLSGVQNPSQLPAEHQSIILQWPSSEWDSRERVFVTAMELKKAPSSVLLQKLDENTLDANRKAYSGGEKRKQSRQRFMGYLWTRSSRLDPRQLFFDNEEAHKVVGDITICIPTLIFIGGTTAAELKELCNVTSLLDIFSSISACKETTYNRTR